VNRRKTRKPNPHLAVVVYHYVRDLPRTRFPRLKGLLTDAFQDQVNDILERFEPATLESALEFLKGRYRPKRNLCLFTFDDGLKEHYTDVLPILRTRGIQGTFFVTTSCLNGSVAAVHKNHFLMAALGFDAYREAFVSYLARHAPAVSLEMDDALAAQTYRWDSPPVAGFKYFFNFKLEPTIRGQALDALFATHLGDEQAFASDLYLSWEEARELQIAGMIVGGHSHTHPALPNLVPNDQRSELATCAQQLRRGLYSQSCWPFSYPYGAFNQLTAGIVREMDFGCSFTVEVGSNPAGQDPFQIHRFDTNDVPAYLGQSPCQ
jgi:peptidoglycan/xylan/chitin deacetylase (PgdA/CDA1 family)